MNTWIFSYYIQCAFIIRAELNANPAFKLARYLNSPVSISRFVDVIKIWNVIWVVCGISIQLLLDVEDDKLFLQRFDEAEVGGLGQIYVFVTCFSRPTKRRECFFSLILFSILHLCYKILFPLLKKKQPLATA